jgi:excisionase family DNA binding protein
MSPTEAPTPTNLLRASEAARRLDMTTKDLLRLIHEREIRYVMVDGIAHVPADAVDEYRSRAAR